MVGLLAGLSTPVQSHNTTGFRGGQRELRSHFSGVPDGIPYGTPAPPGLGIGEVAQLRRRLPHVVREPSPTHARSP